MGDERYRRSVGRFIGRDECASGVRRHTEQWQQIRCQRLDRHVFGQVAERQTQWHGRLPSGERAEELRMRLPYTPCAFGGRPRSSRLIGRRLPDHDEPIGLFNLWEDRGRDVREQHEQRRRPAHPERKRDNSRAGSGLAAAERA